MDNKFLQIYIDTILNKLNSIQAENLQMAARIQYQEDLLKENNILQKEKDDSLHKLTDDNKKLKIIVEEYNNVKEKLNHFDTFQNEIIKLSQENENLIKHLNELKELKEKNNRKLEKSKNTQTENDNKKEFDNNSF